MISYRPRREPALIMCREDNATAGPLDFRQRAAVPASAGASSDHGLQFWISRPTDVGRSMIPLVGDVMMRQSRRADAMRAP
jgi:hypothetical protein